MIDGDLRNLFIDHLNQFDWARIETGCITPGVADSNACGEGVEFWVEFKRTTGWAVTFPPLQVSWIHRRWRYGGRVWVAVRRTHGGGPRRGAPADDLYLVHGQYVRELSALGLRLPPQLVTGQWHGGEEKWDWGQIGELLVA